MTAPSPAGSRTAPAALGYPLGSLAIGSVDVFDVAARLESAGINDRAAVKRYGSADVFILAAFLHRSTPAPDQRHRRRIPLGFGASVHRALLLVVGVLLAGTAVETLDIPATLVWLAGGMGWLSSQVVAAVAWHRLGWGHGAAGQRVGATVSLLVLATAGAVAFWAAPRDQVLVGMVLSVAWTAYASSVSLLVCGSRTRSVLVVVLLGAATVAGATALDRPWSATVVAAAAVATAGLVLVLAARLVVASGGLGLPNRADLGVAVPALAQALLLAAALLGLLRTLPAHSAMPIVVGSVVGAATADPAIALLRRRLRSSAARLYAIHDAARQARHAALVAAAGTAAVSALAAVTVVLALRLGDPTWGATVLTAAAFTAMATTAAALTAFGAPWAAAAAAALTAGYAAVAQASWLLGTVAVFPVALLVALALLLHRVSDPRAVV